MARAAGLVSLLAEPKKREPVPPRGPHAGAQRPAGTPAPLETTLHETLAERAMQPMQAKAPAGHDSGYDDLIAAAREPAPRAPEPAETPPAQAASAHVSDALRSPARPLDPSLRATLEPGFGHDLSRVRIHTDPHAAESARSMGARAYTVGHDVVFAPGRYQPGTGAGQHLIAHEVAHTLQQQQSAAGAVIQPDLERGAPRDHLEREAHMAARQALRSAATAPMHLSSAAPGVQCDSGEITVDLEVPTPQEREQLKQKGVDLPKVSAATADPRIHSDYIDRRLTAVGFGIYLGGYLLFCEGIEHPIFVSEPYVNLGQTNAAPVDPAIFPSYQAAAAAIPFGPPAPGQPVPYAYYRAVGGTLIVPTLFSPASTPKIARTMIAARQQLAERVQQDLAVLALSLVGGALLRRLYSRVARAGEGAPAAPKQQSGSGTANAPPRGQAGARPPSADETVPGPTPERPTPAAPRPAGPAPTTQEGPAPAARTPRTEPTPASPAAAPANVRPPATRHHAKHVDQSTVAKNANSVLEPRIDVNADLQAIRAGRAQVGRAPGGDTTYTVNGRTYGMHPNGTLYPMHGDGVHVLDRGGFKALGVYNKFGNTPQAEEILKAMGIADPARAQALRVWRACQ